MTSEVSSVLPNSPLRGWTAETRQPDEVLIHFL